MKMRIFMRLTALLVAISTVALTCCKKSGGDSTEQTQTSASSPIDDTLAPQYEIGEFINALSSSPYADETLTDDGIYGLSDASEVGIKRSDIKELYPIDKAGLTVVDYSDSDKTEPYDILKDAFVKAKTLNDSGKKALIRLPENGEIIIDVTGTIVPPHTSAYVLSGYDGLYIDGNGCTVKITYRDFDYAGFITFIDCKDVHINDLRLDYQIPTTAFGLITEIDAQNRVATVKADASCNETLKRAKAANAPLWSYVEFDGITGSPKENGNFCTRNENQITGWELLGNDSDGYTVKVKFGAVYNVSAEAVYHNANLAFTMYAYNGYTFTRCEKVYLENDVLNTCPGMGIVAGNTTDIYVNRFDIVLPENSGRLMTTTADGMHFGECFGDLKVTNCVIENTHDDALNVKSGYYYLLSNVNTRNKEIIITQITSAVTVPEIDNVIEIYDKISFERKAALTVAGVETISNGYKLTVKEVLQPLGASSWANNCVATNVSKIADFTFKNNLVRNKRNRGILVQVRGGEILNNTFSHVGHGAISVHSSLDQFNEATMPKDMVIKNNKLINNNYIGGGSSGDIRVFAQATAAAPVGTITGVGMENNFISGNGGAGIFLLACGECGIKNNLFHNNGYPNSGEIYECAVNLTNTGNIEITGNYNQNTTDSESYAGIMTSGLTDTKTITLIGNRNLNYQVISGEVVTTRVYKLTSAVTVDGDVSEWAAQGTEIDMIGHSLATGAYIDPNEYSDVFGVKMCKLGWADDGIYIAFAVKDDRYDFKTVNNFWTGDCFELFYSTELDMASADLQLYKDTADVMQIAMTPVWNFCFAAVRTNGNIVSAKDAFRSACVLTSDGYCGEIFLPFSVLSVSRSVIENGGEIAMAFVFADNDRDDLARKRVQVANVPHFVEVWKTKTAKMQRFVFVLANNE